MDCWEIVDRADTAGYLVSVDSLNEMLDVINALESEVEHLTIQQMFTARGDKEQWGDRLRTVTVGAGKPEAAQGEGSRVP